MRCVLAVEFPPPGLFPMRPDVPIDAIGVRILVTTLYNFQQFLPHSPLDQLAEIAQHLGPELLSESSELEYSSSYVRTDVVEGWAKRLLC